MSTDNLPKPVKGRLAANKRRIKKGLASPPRLWLCVAAPLNSPFPFPGGSRFDAVCFSLLSHDSFVAAKSSEPLAHTPVSTSFIFPCVNPGSEVIPPGRDRLDVLGGGGQYGDPEASADAFRAERVPQI